MRRSQEVQRIQNSRRTQCTHAPLQCDPVRRARETHISRMLSACNQVPVPGEGRGERRVAHPFEISPSGNFGASAGGSHALRVSHALALIGCLEISTIGGLFPPLRGQLAAFVRDVHCDDCLREWVRGVFARGPCERDMWQRISITPCEPHKEHLPGYQQLRALGESTRCESVGVCAGVALCGSYTRPSRRRCPWGHWPCHQCGRIRPFPSSQRTGPAQLTNGTCVGGFRGCEQWRAMGACHNPQRLSQLSF